MLFLFLALLPLLNAVFDYLSYLINFILLRWGYRRPHWTVVLGLADLVLPPKAHAALQAGIAVDGA